MVVSVKPAQRVIIGGVLLHLTIGTLYCFGNIQPYVTSYLRLYDPTITTKDTSIIYSCAALANSLTMPLAGLLQFALGIRGCAALGAGLVVLATLGSSTATTVTGLATLNAVFGCGISFVYTCPIVSGYAWMPHRKGTVSGFVVGGFGAGAAVFNAVSIAWLNPSNISPNPATGYYSKDIAERVPGMYLLLAACFCIMGFSGASMLAPPPAGRDRVNLIDSFQRDQATKSVPGDMMASSRGYSSLGTDTDSDPGAAEEQDARSTTQPKVGSDNVNPDDFGDRDEEFPREGLLVEAETSAKGTRTGTNSWVTIDGQARGAGTATRPYSENAGAQVNADSPGSTRTMLEVERLGVKRENLQHQYALQEVVMELDFYHMALSFCLTAVSGLFIAGNYKAIANHHFPNADRFLSVIGSLASLFNAGGRIVAGFAIDRFGCSVTLMAMSTGMTCLLVFMYASAGATKGLFLISICALFMVYGSNFAIYPTLTAELFGVSSAGSNYGLAFMIYGTASFFIMINLADIAGSDRVYLTCAVLSLMGTISVTFLWFKGRQVPEKQ